MQIMFVLNAMLFLSNDSDAPARYYANVCPEYSGKPTRRRCYPYKTQSLALTGAGGHLLQVICTAFNLIS
jgi:hypothetical protein